METAEAAIQLEQPTESELSAGQLDVRFKEVSLAEHLAVQRAALQKKHRAEVSEYHKRIQALMSELAGKTPQSSPHSQQSVHFQESVIAKIKLERYQLVKSVWAFMAEILGTLQHSLSKDELCDLQEKCHIEHLEKVKIFHKRYKLTSLFNSSLDRLAGVSLKHSVQQLEDTLKSLISKTKDSVDDIRKVWQFRLKRLLDKDARTAIMLDKCCQTDDFLASAKAPPSRRHLTSEQSMTRGLTSGQVIKKESTIDKNLKKDLMQEFKKVEYKRKSMDLLRDQPLTSSFEILHPVIFKSDVDRRAEPPKQYFEKRRHRQMTRSIELETIKQREGQVENRHHRSTRSSANQDSGPTDTQKSSDVLIELQSVGTLSPVDIPQVFKNNYQRRVTRNPMGLSMRIDELSHNQILGDLNDDLNKELTSFKDEENKFQLFNPYTEFIYEKRDQKSASYSRFKLKRLKLEEEFLQQILQVPNFCKTIVSLRFAFGGDSKTQQFALKSLKMLMRLSKKTFSSCSELLGLLGRVKRHSTYTGRVEQLNDEVTRLHHEFESKKKLFALFERRASLKKKIMEKCSYFGDTSSSKSIAMLIASENGELISLDDEILAIVEEIKASYQVVPLFRGLHIEDLIEIDLWEIHTLNKLRRTVDDFKQPLASTFDF